MGEIAKRDENQGQVVTAPTPSALLAMAVQQGADLERLEKLMELQTRWEANEARKAYVAAMTAFKANPPELLKNKTVSFGDTSYKHATLDHVVKTITEALSKHGLSHRWIVEQLDAAIRVTCVITHILGHSESTSLQAGADQSGKKNNIQAIGSTVAYLERYTLLAATGLAAKDMDDDARGVVERITEKQVADLQALIEEVGADQPKFLRYFKIAQLGDLAAGAYSDAVKALEAKRGKKK